MSERLPDGWFWEEHDDLCLYADTDLAGYINAKEIVLPIDGDMVSIGNAKRTLIGAALALRGETRLPENVLAWLLEDYATLEFAVAMGNSETAALERLKAILAPFRKQWEAAE